MTSYPTLTQPCYRPSMSASATRWAWLQAISPTDKLVLLALAWRADAQGQARVSIAALADDTGFDERTVRRALSRLHGRSIEYTRQRYAVTTYRFAAPPGRKSAETTTTVVPAGTKSGGDWVRQLVAKAVARAEERADRNGYRRGRLDERRSLGYPVDAS